MVEDLARLLHQSYHEACYRVVGNNGPVPRASWHALDPSTRSVWREVAHDLINTGAFTEKENTP